MTDTTPETDGRLIEKEDTETLAGLYWTLRVSLRNLKRVYLA